MCDWIPSQNLTTHWYLGSCVPKPCPSNCKNHSTLFISRKNGQDYDYTANITRNGRYQIFATAKSVGWNMLTSYITNRFEQQDMTKEGLWMDYWFNRTLDPRFRQKTLMQSIWITSIMSAMSLDINHHYQVTIHCDKGVDVYFDRKLVGKIEEGRNETLVFEFDMFKH